MLNKEKFHQLQLSTLLLTDKKEDLLLQEVQEVLFSISVIEKIDVSNLELFEHPLIKNAQLREDKLNINNNVDILLNAPSKKEKMISVPKVI